MALLGLALTPVYIAGIQVLTAARAAGERIGFLALVNDAVRYWPRVTFLWLFVIVCYAFWTVLPVGFAGALAIGGPSYLSILLALVLLGVQVWVTGRLFVNFLFWQQFAVLEGCDVGESLRRSKELARSRQDIRWYRRPMWRGIFIASLWFAFVFVLNWPSVDSVFRTIYSTPDPAAMAEALRKTAEQISQSQWTFVVNLIQAFCKPLLGIAFVLLFLESNSSRG